MSRPAPPILRYSRGVPSEKPRRSGTFRRSEGSLHEAATTLGALLEASASRAPGAPAIVAPGRPDLPYAGLLAQLRAVGEALAGVGVGPADRVALALPNGPEMATAFLGVASAAACAPLNPGYRERELDFYLGDLGAAALLVPKGDAGAAGAVARARGVRVLELEVDVAEPAGVFHVCADGARIEAAGRAARPEADETALVLHTSGTTSRPKLVPLSQRNLCRSAENIRSWLALGPADRCLNVMPLFHIHGLVAAVLASLAGGGSLVATPGFRAADFFGWLDAFAPTWYTAVPTLHQAILARAGAHADTIARRPLRFLRSSSAALPPRTLAELEATFGAPVIESYGMTEAAHQVASNPLPPAQRKPGHVGLAAGPELAILGAEGDLLAPGAIGEVAIRGENVMGGYAANPDANRAAFHGGWFRTGDQGVIDAGGYLQLTGRLKELINRGGEKIAPAEIDQVLTDHPGVAQAVTFAIAHPQLGEEIGAAVVPRDGHEPTQREILAFASDRLADFKLPRRVVFLDEIPKGATGKLQRIGLAEKLGVVWEEEGERPPFAAPETGSERAIARFWEEILDVSRVGRDDDFFALGGDSLAAAELVVRVEEECTAELPIYELFESPTLRAMAAYADAHAAGASVGPPLARGGADAPRPLSTAQEAMWVQDQLTRGSSASHRPGAVRLRGPLDVDTLARSLTEVARRHESLRSVFPLERRRPTAEVTAAADLALPREDLSHLPAAEREPALQRLARERVPFDLERGPLLRARLVRLDPTEHVLLIDVHHLVFDGGSMGVLVGELAALYAAFAAGRVSPLPEPVVQAVDVARWQRARFEAGAAEANLAWWKEVLDGDVPVLELPGAAPRAGIPGAEGATCTVALPRELAAGVRDLGRGERATLFMTLFAAFAALLHRITGSEDVVVGTLVATRERAETRDLIGLLIESLVLRVDCAGDPSFRDLLRRARERILGAYAHRDVPFESLVRTLRPALRLGRNPYFDVLFQLRPAPVRADAGALSLEELPLDFGIARFDLLLEVSEEGDGLSVHCTWRTDRFREETVQAWLARWRELLECVARRPEARLSELP